MAELEQPPPEPELDISIHSPFPRWRVGLTTRYEEDPDIEIRAVITEAAGKSPSQKVLMIKDYDKAITTTVSRSIPTGDVEHKRAIRLNLMVEYHNPDAEQEDEDYYDEDEDDDGQFVLIAYDGSCQLQSVYIMNILGIEFNLNWYGNDEGTSGRWIYKMPSSRHASIGYTQISQKERFYSDGEKPPIVATKVIYGEILEIWLRRDESDDEVARIHIPLKIKRAAFDSLLDLEKSEYDWQDVIRLEQSQPRRR